MIRISSRSFRFFSILSLAAVMTLAAAAQTPQPTHEQMNKKQINSLIASASTSADHQRIADYYEGQAQDFHAQAQEHQAMVASYQGNAVLTNNKNRRNTIDHCAYFVTTFNAMSVKSHELAQIHERMAKQAAPATPASQMGR